MCRASRFDSLEIVFAAVAFAAFGLFCLVYTAFTIQINRADTIMKCYELGGYWDMPAKTCKDHK